MIDPQGIDVETVKSLEERRRARISAYLDEHPRATFVPGATPWHVPCDIAVPCATEHELDEHAARQLIENGCRAVVEGANFPCTAAAIAAFQAAPGDYVTGANVAGVPRVADAMVALGVV